MANIRSDQFRYAVSPLLIVALVAGCAAPVETPQGATTAADGSSNPASSDIEPEQALSPTMVAQIQILSDEVRSLRDQVDVLEVELDQTKQRQKDLYDDLDARLRKMEPPAAPESDEDTVGEAQTDPETAAPSEDASGEISVEVPAASEDAVDPEVVREVYDTAFRTLREGKYEDAIIEFKALIQDYPESELVDDALYWIAEANYVTKNYEVALPVFEQIIRDYSENRRAPEAMLKIGYIYYDMQDYEQAQNYLLEVIDRFPASRSAFSARRRLDKMQRDGNL